MARVRQSKAKTLKSYEEICHIAGLPSSGIDLLGGIAARAQLRTRERSVGAALRGPPSVVQQIQEDNGLKFGEHVQPRAATEGRPYSTYRSFAQAQSSPFLSPSPVASPSPSPSPITRVAVTPARTLPELQAGSRKFLQNRNCHRLWLGSK